MQTDLLITAYIGLQLSYVCGLGRLKNNIYIAYYYIII